MPQQINLLLPVQQVQKRSFSALAMGKSLALVALVAFVLAAFLNYQAAAARIASRALRIQMTNEQQQLQAVIAGLPVASDTKALQQQFDTGQQKLEGQRHLLKTLTGGLAQDGHRHSDLLQLLAATVPPQVWLIELRWQTGQLELDGATLDTSALRAWLDRLALQPLLEGLQLTTIKVEKSNLGASKGALADSWNFTLRSQTPAVDGTANHPAAVLTKP